MILMMTITSSTYYLFQKSVSKWFINISINKMLSYRSKTALQGALVLAKSGRLEPGDNIL